MSRGQLLTCCKYSTPSWQSIMRKVTWRRFDQSAKQLVVGQTTIDNAQSHVTAFRPISEAARSWSDDKADWQWWGTNVRELTRTNFSQESSNWWRKVEISTLGVLNLLSFLQCFNTVAWVSWMIFRPYEARVVFSFRASGGRNYRDQLSQLYMGKCS